MAVDPLGRILIAGYGDGSNHDADAFVCRYNSNGTLDTSFNSSGKAVYNHVGWDDISAMVVDPSGSVFIAGEITSANADYDMAILKYTTGGILDPSFNTTGIVTYDAGGDEGAYAIAVDPSGYIYVSGGSSSTDEAWLFKYNSSGNPVTGFGSNGKAMFSGGNSNYGNAIAIDANGKIVVGGGSNNGTNDMSVWRYNSDNGTPDTSFNSSGKANYNNGGNEWGHSVTIDDAGRILLLGNNTAGNMILCCFTPSGVLDTTFGGGDGVVVYGSGEVYGNAIACAYSGKILVAGYKGTGGHWKATLWRFNSDGTLDTTFNSGQGYISSTLTAGDRDERGQAVVTDSLGRYLMGGWTNNAITSDDIAIWRFE